MNFASAFISMTRGHKVARSHWSGYWHIVDGIIMIHTKGFKINGFRRYRVYNQQLCM